LILKHHLIDVLHRLLAPHPRAGAKTSDASPRRSLRPSLEEGTEAWTA
jgi:hypothetical protein